MKCTICGKELPNKFSIAGTCTEKGCNEVFCSLHWNNSNKKCIKHGYMENPSSTEKKEPKMNENTSDNNQQKHVLSAKQAMEFIRKISTGTIALIKKFKKDRSPAAAITAINGKIAEISAQKENVLSEIDNLSRTITSKKNEYSTASRARKEIIEEELKNLLVSYNSAKRTYKILLENERHMSLVKGRLGEITAYGMKTISESSIDDIIEELEQAVDEAEGISDASRDLEKAGKRREREDDKENLWDALAAFDEDAEKEYSQQQPLHDFSSQETKKQKNDRLKQPEKED